MTRIYVAAHCQKAGRAVRDAVPGVVSSWLDEDWSVPEEDMEDQELHEIARLDLDEVAACDVLVLVLPDRRVAGGLWVEFGAALALKKRVVLLSAPGVVSNVFASLADVVVSNLADLRRALRWGLCETTAEEP